ncbi:bifunctional GNAT family N-acetyltransferase/acetate--CoA ligase family protein [Streptomyces sp. PT12]|uniref:bifunctional acetate--CoA ligase family protein/GNAT family N-acetyltransferase n=1 Tax=Streptomyces sp. PT12 TaxID=1510197 RepID=UPI000DE3F961|nr:bifunctional GNAT family N-acetyltransferase/acetate--CoA ligase family protein [Streptomyces sp. PT12]RBM20630.1 acyl-CoA synthetase [Streptomyces sp. PT12]
MRAPAKTPYPAHWEADVVLRDGGTAHIRPITPDDADRLVSFYERVSDESKYYRFFAPYPRLSDRDVHRFTHHDYVDRVGLAATVGDDFLATVRYDRVDERGAAASPPADRAEVAFLVEDAHQGRGLASALLEHIAAVAGERGIRRFEAEVLPANSAMIKVFTDAGYAQRRSFADGSVHLTLDLEPTAESLAVMRAREQRAEARSVQRLLAPRSVAVVGVSRGAGGAGRGVLAGLRAGGFTGSLYAVNAALPAGRSELGGVPAFRSVGAIGAPVDLAVLAVPAARVADVVADCGEHGTQGLVVLAAGHSRDEQRELVARARAYGMRIIGPDAFGVINTAPAVRLNASPAPRLPRAGRIGLFTQSAAIGIAVLDELERRGAGLSTFLSAGNRADLSGNDALQYWYEDRDTDVALMYLESVGNPRKFTRVARRSAAAGKPVVVVRGGRHSGGLPPHGHAVPVGNAPEPTVSALLSQAGVIETDTAVELVDTGLLLAHQPLPRGPRVAVVGRAEALALVAYDACRAQGLKPLPPSRPDDLGPALEAALADPGTDAVVVTAVPTVDDEAGDPDEGEVVRAVADAVGRAAGGGKPVVVAHLALDRLASALSARGVPAYPSAERAVRALAHAVRHAAWRADAAEPGRVPAYDDIDEPAAARVLADATRADPGGAAPAVVLDADRTRELLAAYGIAVPPTLPAPDPDAAVEAARRLGYPVALKPTAGRLRHRADLGGVRLGLATEGELRRAHAELTRHPSAQSAPGALRLVVQAMVPRGVDTVARATVDPAVGALLSFGLAGAPSELLGDVGHRLLPVTDRDAAELVRSIAAAPMLFGWRGAEPVDTAALEELLLRLGRLVDDHPEIAEVTLEPVVVAPRGATALAAAVHVAPPPPRADLGPRRLPAY